MKLLKQSVYDNPWIDVEGQVEHQVLNRCKNSMRVQHRVQAIVWIEVEQKMSSHVYGDLDDL